MMLDKKNATKRQRNTVDTIKCSQFVALICSGFTCCWYAVKTEAPTIGSGRINVINLLSLHVLGYNRGESSPNIIFFYEQSPFTIYQFYIFLIGNARFSSFFFHLLLQLLPNGTSVDWLFTGSYNKFFLRKIYHSDNCHVKGK